MLDIVEYTTNAEIREYCRQSEKEFKKCGYNVRFAWTKICEENIINVKGILNKTNEN